MNCFGLLLSIGAVCSVQVCCGIRNVMSWFEKSCRTSRLLMFPLYCQNLYCTYSSGPEGRIISIPILILLFQLVLGVSVMSLSYNG